MGKIIKNSVEYSGSVMGSNQVRLVIGEEQKIGVLVENGIEYPLYRKLIDFGQLPADSTTKSVPHGIDPTKIYRVLDVKAVGARINSNGNFATSIPIPYAAPNLSVEASREDAIRLQLGLENISIQPGKDRSNLNTCIVTVTWAKKVSP